jgi:hypothetical protein
MGDLKACDDQADTFRCKSLLLGTTDRVGHPEAVGCGLGRQVGPAVHLGYGYDEYVAPVEGADVNHRHAVIIPPDDPAWYLALDYPCED